MEHAPKATELDEIVVRGRLFKLDAALLNKMKQPDCARMHRAIEAIGPGKSHREITRVHAELVTAALRAELPDLHVIEVEKLGGHVVIPAALSTLIALRKRAGG